MYYIGGAFVNTQNQGIEHIINGTWGPLWLGTSQKTPCLPINHPPKNPFCFCWTSKYIKVLAH